MAKKPKVNRVTKAGQGKKGTGAAGRARMNARFNGSSAG